ncbi:hypothetical protein OBBRIDRAFT_890179 [Obba rivulosa]|uniref:Uncharacterized protein n=1 Tax=Obba rivulosa TaxID=1052685 RepID=A0A8E2AR69_9APHY|nr:hypothetical protein OBBRIDRAFT_890179 [Obba rivulosa]
MPEPAEENANSTQPSVQDQLSRLRDLLHTTGQELAACKDASERRWQNEAARRAEDKHWRGELHGSVVMCLAEHESERQKGEEESSEGLHPTANPSYSLADVPDRDVVNTEAVLRELRRAHEENMGAIRSMAQDGRHQ